MTSHQQEGVVWIVFLWIIAILFIAMFIDIMSLESATFDGKFVAGFMATTMTALAGFITVLTIKDFRDERKEN